MPAGTGSCRTRMSCSAAEIQIQIRYREATQTLWMGLESFEKGPGKAVGQLVPELVHDTVQSLQTQGGYFCRAQQRDEPMPRLTAAEPSNEREQVRPSH